MISKDKEWKKYKFSDLFDINPKINIKKLSNIPYVELKDIKIGFRDVFSKNRENLRDQNLNIKTYCFLEFPHL